MSETNVTTEKKVSPAVKALKELGSYKQEIELKLTEFEQKTNKMLARQPVAANKNNALAGVAMMKDFLSDFKTKRIEKTNVITSIVKIFTEKEATLLALQNKLQDFANKCLENEKSTLGR